MPPAASHQAERWLTKRGCRLIECSAATIDRSSGEAASTVTIQPATATSKKQDATPTPTPTAHAETVVADLVFSCVGGVMAAAPYLCTESGSRTLRAAVGSDGCLEVGVDFSVRGLAGTVFAVGDVCRHPSVPTGTAQMAKWTAAAAAASVVAALGQDARSWRRWPAYLWLLPRDWPSVYCVSLGQSAACIVMNRTVMPGWLGNACGGVMKHVIEVRKGWAWSAQAVDVSWFSHTCSSHLPSPFR